MFAFIKSFLGKILHKVIKSNFWSDKSRIRLTKLLLFIKADPNAKDKDGKTALHFAVQYGHREIVQLLLDQQADPNRKDKDGKTPLDLAQEKLNPQLYQEIIDIFNSKWEVVGFLAEKCASLNKEKSLNQQLLDAAVISGSRDRVEQLLNMGEDIDAVDNDGYTSLHLAALRGHQDVVKILLEKGANINSADLNSITPLHLAASCGYQDVVKILLEKGANINSGANIRAGFDPVTPLCIANANGRLEVCKLLIQYMLAQNVNVERLDTVNHTRELLDYLNQCKAEIETMKGCYLGSISKRPVSSYDFFTEQNDVKLASHLNNDAIFDKLNSDEYKEKFPIFADLLQNKITLSDKKANLQNKVNELILPSDDGKVSLIPDVMKYVNEYFYNDNKSRLNLVIAVGLKPSEKLTSEQKASGSIKQPEVSGLQRHRNL